MTSNPPKTDMNVKYLQYLPSFSVNISMLSLTWKRWHYNVGIFGNVTLISGNLGNVDAVFVAEFINILTDRVENLAILTLKY